MRPLPKVPPPSHAVVDPSRLASREHLALWQEIVRRLPRIGSAVFVSDDEIAVTLTPPETSDDYVVQTEIDAEETVWITDKTVNGFTINSSEASSTANVRWALFRT